MKVRRAHTTYKWIGKVRGTIPMDFVLYDSHVAIPSINHIRTVHLNPIIDTDQIISLEDIYRKPTALHFQQGTPTLLHLTSLARVHIIVYRYTHTAHQQHTLTILAFLTSACVCLPICTLPWALHSSTPTHTHRQARWHPDLPKFDLIRTALRLTVNPTTPAPTTTVLAEHRTHNAINPPIFHGNNAPLVCRAHQGGFQGRHKLLLRAYSADEMQCNRQNGVLDSNKEAFQGAP
jgi:hypothetical protein